MSHITVTLGVPAVLELHDGLLDVSELLPVAQQLLHVRPHGRNLRGVCRSCRSVPGPRHRPHPLCWRPAAWWSIIYGRYVFRQYFYLDLIYNQTCSVFSIYQTKESR